MPAKHAKDAKKAIGLMLAFGVQCAFGQFPFVLSSVPIVIPVVTNPPVPYHVTLVWEEPDSNAVSYLVEWGTNGAAPIRTNATATPALTVSNLWGNTSYAFDISAVDSFGIESTATRFVWPWAKTNVAWVLWSTNVSGPWVAMEKYAFTNDDTPNWFLRGFRTNNIDQFVRADR